MNLPLHLLKLQLVSKLIFMGAFVYVLLLSFLPLSYLKIVYWITMISVGLLLVYKIRKAKNCTSIEKFFIAAVALLIFGYFLYIMTKLYLIIVNI